MKTARTLGLALALAATGACSDDPAGTTDVGPSPGGDTPGNQDPQDPVVGSGYMLLQSDVPRDTAPSIADADRIAAAQDTRDFAWDIYHLASEGEDNSFFSPYSISTALAMAYAGAGSETKTEMAAALHFGDDDDVLHSSFNALDLALAGRNLPKTENLNGLTLSGRNAVWAEEATPPTPAYLDALALNYGAGVYAVDFFNEPEEARQTINAAVQEWTNDLIKDLLPEGLINQQTAMVLTNTIYLYAPWQTPFEEFLTEDRAFGNLDGSQVQVPTMKGTPDARYARKGDTQVLALPYREGQLEMVFLLPDAGAYEAVEQTLDGPTVDGLLEDLQAGPVQLELPRFSLEQDLSLKKALQQLGMELAFIEGQADFGAIGGRVNYIADVVHKAFLDVDEQGTEAAAATAVVFADESAGPPPLAEVKLDRPFVFAIRDVPTDTVLFLGRVVSLEP